MTGNDGTELTALNHSQLSNDRSPTEMSTLHIGPQQSTGNLGIYHRHVGGAILVSFHCHFI